MTATTIPQAATSNVVALPTPVDRQLSALRAETSQAVSEIRALRDEVAEAVPLPTTEEARQALYKAQAALSELGLDPGVALTNPFGAISAILGETRQIMRENTETIEAINGSLERIRQGLGLKRASEAPKRRLTAREREIRKIARETFSPVSLVADVADRVQGRNVIPFRGAHNPDPADDNMSRCSRLLSKVGDMVTAARPGLEGC